MGGHLGADRGLPERSATVVADNGSSDGAVAAMRRCHPRTRVVPLGCNLGAGARTVEARSAATPRVACSDDDSWWRPGTLERAVELLDADQSTVPTGPYWGQGRGGAQAEADDLATVGQSP